MWGAYQLSADYTASYSNGDAIRRGLGVDLWTGSVETNSVTLTLQPPAEADQGQVDGTVTGRKGRMDEGILVSLTDDHEQLMIQVLTGFDGRFRFNHLSYGRYWITVRRPGARRNTSFFEHADVSGSRPSPRLKLIMLHRRVYRSRQMRHKPVLFRVTDLAGHPVAHAALKLLWSNGDVLQNLKAETDEKGLALLSLIPGTNYVTLTGSHCRKKNRTAKVAHGPVIDGFAFTLSCRQR